MYLSQLLQLPVRTISFCCCLRYLKNMFFQIYREADIMRHPVYRGKLSWYVSLLKHTGLYLIVVKIDHTPKAKSIIILEGLVERGRFGRGSRLDGDPLKPVTLNYRTAVSHFLLQSWRLWLRDLKNSRLTWTLVYARDRTSRIDCVYTS